MLPLVVIIRNVAASRYPRNTRKNILNEHGSIDTVVLDVHITFFDYYYFVKYFCSAFSPLQI